MHFHHGPDTFHSQQPRLQQLDDVDVPDVTYHVASLLQQQHVDVVHETFPQQPLQQHCAFPMDMPHAVQEWLNLDVPE